MAEVRNISLRPPVLEDGMDVFRLIERCPPLDENSSYCNLLQCSHFANTSVVAESEGAPVGFISGYIIPDRTNTLFIWQVAVSEPARGCGLASRMLAHILARPYCADIRYLETTITENNSASWALFKSHAQASNADLQSLPWMDKDIHFQGQHESETLVRIGPFACQS